MNYIFATKGMRSLCIQYPQSEEMRLLDHLFDEKGWEIRISSKEFFTMAIDEDGNPLTTRTIHANTKIDI